MISFPLFLNRKNKIWVGLLWSFVASVLYLTSNHNPIFEPKFLNMWWIDSATPFIPQTIWIYASEIPFFLTVYFLSKNLENTNKYLYAFFFLQLVSVAIFVIYPTTYPRDLFPLTEKLDPFTFSLFGSLRVTDAPTNCLPSLHVSSCYLSSFVFLKEQQKKFPLFFIWASAIAISTLTTKQHYIIDVIVGFLMAVVFYWIFYRCVKYKKAKYFYEN